MTLSPNVAPQPVSTLEHALELLRARGLRVSTSRRLVLEALFATEVPLSAEQLSRAVDIDVASVHRNLETLERLGLVRHVHLGHGPGLYALLRCGEREYLYCHRCGAVKALAPQELDPIRRRIRDRHGYEARFSHFPIVGLCEGCARAG